MDTETKPFRYGESELRTMVINIDPEWIAGWRSSPADAGRSSFYLIHDDRVIGKMRRESSRSNANGTSVRVSVQPYDEATHEFFKNYPNRMADGYCLGLNYDGVLGLWRDTIEDVAGAPYTDTRIVDTLDFDFGFAHKELSHIPGYGKALKKSHLKLNIPQKRRRPRKSRKIH